MMARPPQATDASLASAPPSPSETSVLARVALWCTLTLALLTLVSHARAQSPVATRAMTVTFNDHTPAVSFAARDFLTPDVRKKLASGLPQRIVTRVYAYSARGERPLGVTALACRVVYDLWEGVYRVEEQTPTTDRTRSERSLDAAVRPCLQARALAVGDAASVAAERGKDIYFGVLIELNPLSADTVQRIRRWLSRSGGGHLGGDAFFGSFVSIFVSRQMGAAERSLAFRSRSFSVP